MSAMKEIQLRPIPPPVSPGLGIFLGAILALIGVPILFVGFPALLAGVVLVLVGATCIWLAVRYLRRRVKPVVRLGPDAVELPGRTFSNAMEAIPYGEIEKVEQHPTALTITTRRNRMFVLEARRFVLRDAMYQLKVELDNRRVDEPDNA
jgi:hypothetical protein